MQYELKLIGRTLWRQREFSLLNILGLAAGIGAGLLIFLVVRYETSFDQFHSRHERIYRVVTSINVHNEDPAYNGCVPIPLPGVIRQDLPQFQTVAATWEVGKTQFSVPPGKTEPTDLPEKKFKQEKGTFYAEPSLFDIFDFPWLSGNPHEALKEPNTAALTRSVADAWFGNWKKAIGRVIYMGDNRIPFTVTGILSDPPLNTDVPLRIVLSYATFLASKSEILTAWGHFDSHSECFLLLGKGQDIRAAASQSAIFSNRYFGKMMGAGNSVGIFFQPLKDVHFDERFETYGEPGISRKELWVLELIGIFLVLVACINFVNLSTAQSFGRSKDVGVRKVLGSSRGQLFARNFRETACIVFLALLLGCIMAEIALPFLSHLIGRNLSLDVVHYPSIGLFLLATGLLVTFLSAVYPGIVLSSFDPIAVFRNRINSSGTISVSLRRGLVIFQFVIAQLLIIGTLVVESQMHYFQSRPLGFDKKAIVMVDLPGNRPSDRPRFEYLKNKMEQIPGVEEASLCSDPPAKDGAWSVGFLFDNDPTWQPFSLISRYADTAYLRTFHMTLMAGRYPYASDTIRELVVNEATVRRLGFRSASAILNKTIRFHDPGQRYPIVGVVRDFNSKSLKEAIAPLVLSTDLDQYQKLAIRLNPQQIDAAMPAIQQVFSQTFPDHVFDYEFFDDAVRRFYQQETIIAALFKIFSVLAIVISCLGLYGLVSFMAVQRTKEIGIRKVLGASVQSIVYLFSREFTLLIILAFLIATPSGYYFMHQWLAGFYYHISVGWQVFVAAITFSVLIAWMAVGYRAARAALTDPVKALKYE